MATELGPDDLRYLELRPMKHMDKEPGVEKREGVCGGSARISGTRIPVWQLVAARDLGVTESQLLVDYPTLQARDLVNAWSYAQSHGEEIRTEIRENEDA
jgi:uncharacterized protein (DUF433 family)